MVRSHVAAQFHIHRPSILSKCCVDVHGSPKRCCKFCNKYGHAEWDCPQNLNCNHCGQAGHRTEDCKNEPKELLFRAGRELERCSRCGGMRASFSRRDLYIPLCRPACVGMCVFICVNMHRHAYRHTFGMCHTHRFVNAFREGSTE